MVCRMTLGRAILRALPGQLRRRAPKTHDFTRRRVGHDYTFEPLPDNRGRLTIWSEDALLAGDYLLLQNQAGDTRYRIDTAERIDSLASDPPPMWCVVATFAPRALHRLT